MPRRNVILLAIVLVIAIIAVIGFLYFRGTGTTPGGTGGGTNFIDIFNPFGNGGQNPPVTPPPTEVPGGTPPPTEVPAGNLKKVSSMPVAGFGIFSKERIITPPPEKGPKTEFVAALRYVERVTGNIFQTFADKIEEQKFSKTVVPKIYEAYFGNKAESVVMRYLKVDEETIQTFVGTLPKEFLGTAVSGENEVKGVFLPEGVKDVSISPDNSKMFYLFNVADTAIGTLFNFSDQKKTQIFENAFTEWNSSWPRASTITLTTKPAAGTPGYMYTLDSGTRRFTKTLGPINGLTTLTSPDGKLVLYSDDSLNLSMYRTDTKDSSTLGTRTLPDKCAWGKKSDVVYCAVPKFADLAAYPDSWYQGETSFADQLWRIDIKTGTSTLLSDPGASPLAEDVDGIKLSLDDAENYLFFVNKKDSFLWELLLK